MLQTEYPSHFYFKYSKARHNFLAAASEPATFIESWQHPLRGLGGEKLYLDLAWFGDRHASKVLLLISGTHGVEGYCGSGIQVGSIRTGWHREADEQVAIAMLHGLNPYGMSHLRRVDEAGIDVNRNFIDFQQPLPSNKLYDDLVEVIIPPQWTTETQTQTLDRLTEYLYHTPDGIADLAKGQYQYWYAPFYGGEVPSWSNRVLQQIGDRFLEDKQAIGILDYHTGLGQHATGQLITLPSTSGAESKLVRSIWGDKAVIAGSEQSVTTYTPKGTVIAALQARLANSRYVAAAYEFGTIPENEVFQALRADHWLYLHGDLEDEPAIQIKQNMLDAFYCDRPDWQKSVCDLAFAAQAELLAGLRSL
ncbi:MAG: DUF2817 domain-containing protein [Cyanobacteria bacterium J06629_2]